MANPNTKRIERQGSSGSPMVHHHPRVIGGVCEFCGILDKNAESIDQYKLCDHYRGMQLRCSYCDPSKSPDEVIRRSRMQVMDHPDRPNELVVLCDSYECSEKHLARFDTSR